MKEIEFPGEYIASKIVMRGCCEVTFSDLYRQARGVITGEIESEYFPDGPHGEEMTDYLFALRARGFVKERAELELMIDPNNDRQ